MLPFKDFFRINPKNAVIIEYSAYSEIYDKFEYHLVPQVVLTAPVGFEIQARTPLKTFLEDFFHRVFEGGMDEFLREKYLSIWRRKNYAEKITKSAEKLSMQNLWIVFCILVVGHFISLIVFIGECIVYHRG